MIEFPDNIWNPIIYSTITVSTLYSGFLCIRPWIKINVECWFCMSKHRIRYLDRNSWYCPCCQQYNGFNVDGSYNRHMNEHYHQSNLNHFCQNNSIINNQFRYEHYRLCDDCNEREAIKIRMIAQFVPVDEQRFDEELFQFRKNLEQMYPICENCNQLVRKLINDIDDSCPKPKSPNRISNSAETTTTTSLLNKNQPGKLLKIFAYSLLNLSTILMLFILICLNVHEEPVSNFAKEFLPNPLSQIINYTNHYHYMICLGFLLYFPLLQIESKHMVIIDIIQICFWLLLITNHHHYYHLYFLDKFDIIRLQRFIIPLLIVTYLIKYFYTIIYDYIWIAANHNHNPLNDTANRKYSKSINDEKLIRNQIKDLSISTTNEFDLFSLGNNIQSPFTRISSKSSKFTKYSLFTNANFMSTNTTMNNDDNFFKSNITTATATMMNSPRILNYYIRYEIDQSNNNDNNCCKHHDQQQQQHLINKHSTNSLCLHLTTTFTLIITLTIFMLMIVILSLPATIKINYEIHNDDNRLSLNIFYPNYTVN